MKKLTGRKGTLYEETYLLNSIKKVVEVKILEFQGPFFHSDTRKRERES